MEGKGERWREKKARKLALTLNLRFGKVNENVHLVERKYAPKPIFT